MKQLKDIENNKAWSEKVFEKSLYFYIYPCKAFHPHYNRKRNIFIYHTTIIIFYKISI